MPHQTSPVAAKPTIVQHGDGQVLHAFGDTLHVKLSGTQTGGSLFLGLSTVPPGGGPPPHIHHTEDELFIVLEGRLSVLASGTWTEVAPGGVVYTPRGNLHTFRNVGDTPSRLWIMVTPGGFEHFFAKCAAAFAAGGPPDLGHLVQLANVQGIEFVPPLTGT